MKIGLLRVGVSELPPRLDGEAIVSWFDLVYFNRLSLNEGGETKMKDERGRERIFGPVVLTITLPPGVEEDNVDGDAEDLVGISAVLFAGFEEGAEGSKVRLNTDPLAGFSEAGLGGSKEEKGESIISHLLNHHSMMILGKGVGRRRKTDLGLLLIFEILQALQD